MEARFQLYLRKHPNGWWTGSVLGEPRYASFRPRLEEVREELKSVLRSELQLKRVVGSTAARELPEQRRLGLELVAVQHERLVAVPLSFLLLVQVLEGGRFHVQVPRLGLAFHVRGVDAVDAWAREEIRGRLHLRSVRELMAYKDTAREKVELLTLRWSAGRKVKAARARKLAASVQEAMEQSEGALASVGTELVVLARRKRVPNALARDADLQRLIDALARPRGRAVCLSGEAGVGKTALVHELAHRIASGRVPPRLQDLEIWRISGSGLMAGMKYLGQWQQRALAIAQTLSRTGGILYIDGLLELLSAVTGRGGLEPGQLLLPFIGQDAFPVIAESTPDALVQAEQRNGAFVRALQPVVLHAMPGSQALEVMQVLGGRLAKGVGAELDPAALQTALDLVARFGDARGLPGTGIALLERMIQGRSGGRLGAAEALDAFCAATGFPRSLVDADLPLDEAQVQAFFTARIIGQPRVVDLLTGLLLVLKAGLGDPDKPMGSFLFAGPTGVGKTESAKALAEWLFGDAGRLVRFDMSEFGGLGSARRLVDGPAGQGELTRRVREQPFCVLLFDEIEKAEPGVFDLLLQVLGEGRLTDATGVTVGFRNCIVILTSNLGAGEDRRIGMVAESAGEADRRFQAAVESFFRPEFVNRLDAVVPFRALSRGDVATIARGMLQEALGREGLSRRGVTVEWDEALLEHLVDLGHDPRYGARPLKRAIDQAVLAPLSRLLAAGVPEGTVLRLWVREGEVELESGPPRPMDEG